MRLYIINVAIHVYKVITGIVVKHRIVISLGVMHIAHRNLSKKSNSLYD